MDFLGVSGRRRPGLRSTDSLNDQEVSRIPPEPLRRHERRWPAARWFVDDAAVGDRPWNRHRPEQARRPTNGPAWRRLVSDGELFHRRETQAVAVYQRNC